MQHSHTCAYLALLANLIYNMSVCRRHSPPRKVTTICDPCTNTKACDKISNERILSDSVQNQNSNHKSTYLLLKNKTSIWTREGCWIGESNEPFSDERSSVARIYERNSLEKNARNKLLKQWPERVISVSTTTIFNVGLWKSHCFHFLKIGNVFGFIQVRSYEEKNWNKNEAKLSGQRTASLHVVKRRKEETRASVAAPFVCARVERASTYLKCWILTDQVRSGKVMHKNHLPMAALLGMLPVRR